MPKGVLRGRGSRALEQSPCSSCVYCPLRYPASAPPPFVWGVAGAGVGGTPRNNSSTCSTCEQRDDCPTLTHLNILSPDAHRQQCIPRTRKPVHTPGSTNRPTYAAFGQGENRKGEGGRMSPVFKGWGVFVRPLQGQTVCMGPTWVPKTKKKENGIFQISTRKVFICPPFYEKKIAQYFSQKLPNSRPLTEKPHFQPPPLHPRVRGAHTTPPPFGAISHPPPCAPPPPLSGTPPPSFSRSQRPWCLCPKARPPPPPTNSSTHGRAGCDTTRLVWRDRPAARALFRPFASPFRRAPRHQRRAAHAARHCRRGQYLRWPRIFLRITGIILSLCPGPHICSAGGVRCTPQTAEGVGGGTGERALSLRTESRSRWRHPWAYRPGSKPQPEGSRAVTRGGVTTGGGYERGNRRGSGILVPAVPVARHSEGWMGVLQ